MRLVSVLLVVFAATSAWAGPTPTKPSGKAVAKKRGSTMITVVQHVNSHCGGAAIPPGENLYNQQYPATGAAFLVRAGKKNGATKVLAQATSDDEGHLWFNLAKGTYCLISPAKRDVSTKLKPEDLAGPPAVAAPIGTGAPAPDDIELSNEEKRVCDLVFTAPTIKAEVGLYSSSCPRLPPGASPPP